MSLASNDKVCFEAEKPAFIQPPFKTVASKSASGGNYLELPWDYNKGKSVGRVTYKFNVKTPGKYYLWARTFWKQDRGHAIKVSVNDESRTQAKVLGQDETYNIWHWIGGKARFALKAGVNTLILWNNETGVRIDMFCLSQEKKGHVRY